MPETIPTCTVAHPRCHEKALMQWTDTRPGVRVVFYRCKVHDAEAVARKQTVEAGGVYRREVLY